MKPSLSMSILRRCLLLVLTGFFLPVAQGIPGHGQKAENARLIEPIADSVGFALFGVPAFATLGLVIAFLVKPETGYFLGLFCLAGSCVLLVVAALEFKSLRDTGVLHFLVTAFRIQVKARHSTRRGR